MNDPRPTWPLIVAEGEILELQEPDHLYGSGPVSLRAISPIPWPHHNTDWVRIHAIQVGWDGSEKDRELLVHIAALLRYAVRHDRKEPS